MSTKDGVLVARHENEIGGTTDVAAHPEFAARKATKTIDGATVTGWFTEDFTLAELKTLRAKERLPAVRPANTAYDGRYEVPTLAGGARPGPAVAHAVTASRSACTPRPSTRRTSTRSACSLEEPLVRTLDAQRLRRAASSPVFVQSFETGNLKQLNRMTSVRLVQLVDCSGAPVRLRGGRRHDDLRRPGDPGRAGRDRPLRGRPGRCKNLIIPRDAAGNLLAPIRVVRDAHRRGLIVHGWTFRRENQFLPVEFRSRHRPQRASATSAARSGRSSTRAWTASSPTTPTSGWRQRRPGRDRLSPGPGPKPLTARPPSPAQPGGDGQASRSSRTSGARPRPVDIPMPVVTDTTRTWSIGAATRKSFGRGGVHALPALAHRQPVGPEETAVASPGAARRGPRPGRRRG